MRRVLLPELPLGKKRFLLPKDEAKHLTRVLRIGAGDTIEAIDGHGNRATGIVEVVGSHVYLSLDNEPRSETKAGDILPLTLACAILKTDAMHVAIEKATELGVKRFIPLLTERSVVKMESKPESHFLTRWQKIADQSLKQCGRLQQMTISNPVSLDQLLKDENNSTVWFFMDESLDANRASMLIDQDFNQETGILIGPEGGWSAKERALIEKLNQVRAISLGPLVLRAETALIASTAIVGAFLRRKK